MTRYRLAAALAAAAFMVAPAAAQQTFELKYGDWVPPQNPANTRVLEPWIEAVQKDAGGALTINWFKGGSLGNQRTIYDNIVNGTADAGFVTPSLVPGRLPRSAVANLPFQAEGLTSSQASTALWRTYQTGVFDGDFREAFPLALTFTTRVVIHTTFPLKTLEDLKGRKLNGGAQTPLIMSLGATAVPVAIPELAQSIGRGVIEGTVLAWMGSTQFRMYDVTTHHLEMPWPAGHVAVFVNRQSYNKIPDKGKAALNKHSGLPLSVGYGKIFEFIEAFDKDVGAKDPKHTITVIDPAENARWRERGQAIINDWVQKTPDGAKILATLHAEVDKVRASLR
jgi:TRAP-type C4-dicarboxylate transport system substrate-binding protein